MRIHFAARAATAVSLASCVLVALVSCSLSTDLDGLSGGAGSDDDGAPSVDALGPVDVSTSAMDAPVDTSSNDALTPPKDAGSESSCAPPALTQSVYTSTSTPTASTLSIALPQAVNAGDYLLVALNYDDVCGSVLGVSDTAGNTFSRVIAAREIGASDELETWGAMNVTATIANTVTASFAAQCGGRNIKVLEYGGVDTTSAVDTTISEIGGPDASPTSVLTASAAAILVVHTADSTSANGSGAGWTKLFTDGWATLAEDQIVDAAGTYPVSYVPAPDDQWVVDGVALRRCH